MASSIPASVPAEAAVGLDAPVRGGRAARRTRWLVAAGGAFVLALALVAITAPWLAPQDPTRQSLRGRLAAPTRPPTITAAKPTSNETRAP